MKAAPSTKKDGSYSNGILHTEANASGLGTCLVSLESLEESKTTEQAQLSTKLLQALAAKTDASGEDMHRCMQTGRVSASKPKSSLTAGSGTNSSDLIRADLLEEWITEFPDCPNISYPQTADDTWSLDSLNQVVRHLQSNASIPLHPVLVLRVLMDVEKVMAAKYTKNVHSVKIPSKSMKEALKEKGMRASAVASQTEANQMFNSKTVDQPGRVIVVGDTHGQLEDVLWIFYRNGLPSPSNHYLFNGDIADRGFFALEIFVLVFGFMVIYPNAVEMNRGNHEDETINLDGHCGGFYEEVMEKYGDAIGWSLYEQIKKIYAYLPLASVLDEKIFIVHGGLTRCQNGGFQILSSLNRGLSAIPANPTNPRDTVFIDSLWADPAEEPGIGVSSRGPSLITFGPDVTMSFLRKNGLHLVIRSHQPPSNKDGVFFHHNGRLMSVFSASNYCGWYNNTGAILILTKGVPKPGDRHGPLPGIEIVRHFSPTFEMLADVAICTNDALGLADLQAKKNLTHKIESHSRRSVARDIGNRMDGLTSEVKMKFARLIVMHKEELWKTYQMESANNPKCPPGMLPFETWKNGLDSVVGMGEGVTAGIPWDQICTLMRIQDPHSKLVDFPFLLNRFQVQMKDESSPDNTVSGCSRKSKMSMVNFRASQSATKGNPSGVMKMTHTNWSEAILSRLFESLLNEEISWATLLNQFEDGGAGSDKNNPRVTPKTLSKALLCVTYKDGSLGKDGGTKLEGGDGGKKKVGNSLQTDDGSASRHKVALSESQCQAVMRTLLGFNVDANPHSPEKGKKTAAKSTDGSEMSLTLQEFLARLEVCYTGFHVHKFHESNSAEDKAIVNKKFGSSKGATVLRLVGRVLYNEEKTATDASQKLYSIFQQADRKGNGHIDKKDFRNVLDKILSPYTQFLTDSGLSSTKGSLSDDIFNEVWELMDTNNKGAINYLSFLHAFQPEDRAAGLGAGAANRLREALLEAILSTIYTNKQALLRAFQYFDKENNNCCAKENFQQVLRTLNQCLSVGQPPLTGEQISMLVDHCMTNGEGDIEYLVFTDSVVIFDMVTGECFA